jgi:hypothetical protein
MENYKIEITKSDWIPSRPWYVTLIEPDGHKMTTGGFKSKKSAILNQVIVWRDIITNSEFRHIDISGSSWHEVFEVERRNDQENQEALDQLSALFSNKGPMD